MSKSDVTPNHRAWPSKPGVGAGNSRNARRVAKRADSAETMGALGRLLVAAESAVMGVHQRWITRPLRAARMRKAATWLLRGCWGGATAPRSPPTNPSGLWWALVGAGIARFPRQLRHLSFGIFRFCGPHSGELSDFLVHTRRNSPTSRSTPQFSIVPAIAVLSRRSGSC